MSLSSSFYTALSGLDTHTVAMQVVRDNIANLNTIGRTGDGSSWAMVVGWNSSTMSGRSETPNPRGQARGPRLRRAGFPSWP